MAAPSDFRLIPGDVGEEDRLELWRRNVGPLVARDFSPSGKIGSGNSRLVVLSWNVWIGRGRLGDVVSRIRDGAFERLGANADIPLVVLLQEAYRSDHSVPPVAAGRVGRLLATRLGPQEDIVEAAHELGLNLRYAPSMRNGTLQSDRGNAILSSLPLEGAHAIELPLVLQRRVAVTAAINFGGRKLWLASAHLDPRGPPGHRWLGAAGRARQAKHLVASLPQDPVILGADLNLGRGRSEEAWRLLGDAGFSFGVPPSSPPWRHTFHAIPRLVLDYLLIRDRGAAVRHAHVHRLDEHPRDRGARVFGSDHHPLLASIELHPSRGEDQWAS